MGCGVALVGVFVAPPSLFQLATVAMRRFASLLNMLCSGCSSRATRIASFTDFALSCAPLETTISHTSAAARISTGDKGLDGSRNAGIGRSNGTGCTVGCSTGGIAVSGALLFCMMLWR